MADDTTTLPVPPHVHGYHQEHRRDSDHGRIADGLAVEAMMTSKDVSTQLQVHANRANDDANLIERSIENAKDRLSDAIASGTNRTLEQFGLTGVLIQKVAGELSTQAVLNAKDGIIDSAKNAAAATLLAVQNQAAVMAKLCECCCEIREAIRSDGDETRELMNTLARRDSERRETDLKIELSNAKQTEVLRALIAASVTVK